jgi:hypothetical protein
VCDERPGVFQLSSTTKADRTGRPLFIASLQVGKNYVSYHLMPLYMNPTLQAAVSPALRKRMQGKSCFNFTSIDRDQLAELAQLTKQGIASFQDVKLPWDDRPPTKKATGRTRSRGGA